MIRLIKMPPSWLNRFIFGLNRFRSSNAPSNCGQPLKVELGKTGNWKCSRSLCFANGSLAFHFPFEIRTQTKMAVPLAPSCSLSRCSALSRMKTMAAASISLEGNCCCRRQLLIFPLKPLPFHPIRHPTSATHRPPLSNHPVPLSALIAMIFNYYRCHVCSAFGHKGVKQPPTVA